MGSGSHLYDHSPLCQIAKLQATCHLSELGCTPPPHVGKGSTSSHPHLDRDQACPYPLPSVGPGHTPFFHGAGSYSLCQKGSVRVRLSLPPSWGGMMTAKATPGARSGPPVACHPHSLLPSLSTPVTLLCSSGAVCSSGGPSSV